MHRSLKPRPDVSPFASRTEFGRMLIGSSQSPRAKVALGIFFSQPLQSSVPFLEAVMDWRGCPVCYDFFFSFILTRLGEIEKPLHFHFLLS